MTSNNANDQEKAERFDRIAAKAEERIGLYERLGMDRSAKAAAITAAKARAAATAHRSAGPCP